MGKPQAPDPWQTASAQGAWNSFTAQQQQSMNMIGQNTPWGSLDYSQNGSTWITDPSGKKVEVPQYTANVNLSPEQQAIFDQSQQAQLGLGQLANQQIGRVDELLSNPFEFNNQDAENWAWDMASPRILQQQGQNQTDLRTQLINSGIRPGTSAWDSEMQRLTNANTDQMNQLALTGRQQAFNESLATRNQPLNEIIGLMSGTQVQNPNASFAQTPQVGVGGVDYTGLVNQKYQQDMSNYSSGMGALGGLFKMGTSLAFSDRRLKENVKRVGHTDDGLPIYVFNYKDDATTHMGVMAQDVQNVRPDAVERHESGYLMVDYRKVH